MFANQYFQYYDQRATLSHSGGRMWPAGRQLPTLCYGFVKWVYMESADHAQIWRSTMPIVMSWFVDGLLISQLRCHSIFGMLVSKFTVMSEACSIYCISSPTMHYTEKREALTWMSQLVLVCGAVTDRRNHGRNF